MPAVTPAEVQTGPSRTKMASRSTSISGWRVSRIGHHHQWVVARRPSSRPSRARIIAPVQIATIRRARRAALATWARSASSSSAAVVPWPPQTTSVSIGWASARASPKVRSTPSRSPEVVVTVPGRAARSETA